MPERHLGVALGSEAAAVGAGPGPARGVEGEDLAVAVDEGEQVAAHAAQVRTGDGDCRVGGDRRVDGVATEGQCTQAGLGGQLIGAGDQCLGERTSGIGARP